MGEESGFLTAGQEDTLPVRPEVVQGEIGAVGDVDAEQRGELPAPRNLRRARRGRGNQGAVPEGQRRVNLPHEDAMRSEELSMRSEELSNRQALSHQNGTDSSVSMEAIVNDLFNDGAAVTAAAGATSCGGGDGGDPA